MEAAHPSHQQDRTLRSHSSERTCLVTGETLPKTDLIRFAISPDNRVTPDLSHNLPGRGLWLKAEREHIDTAVRKNLFSKGARKSVKADADLADQVASLMRKRCLDFLGFARRAGIAVLGQPQVEAALKSGKLVLLLIADDASQALDNRKPVPEYRGFNRDELGAALGHEQIVYAGLKADALAEKLTTELARLEKITAPPHTIFATQGSARCFASSEISSAPQGTAYQSLNCEEHISQTHSEKK